MASLTRQIQEVDRELALRAKVYPNQVASGRMRQAEEDYHVESLKAVRETLRWLQENEATVRAAVKAKKEAAA